MNTFEKPPEGMVRALLALDQQLACMTIGLKTERLVTVEDISPLFNAIDAQHAAVKGNRPDTEDITWADLRLALAGTLRICLSHLEGVEV